MIHCLSLSKDNDYRWVGMQPITEKSSLSSAKWVDNTSAQEVFDAAVKNEDPQPLCLAFFDGLDHVLSCRHGIGYICERSEHLTQVDILLCRLC